MANRHTARWFWATAIALLPAVAAAQASHVSLSIDERGVTLEAHDATLREILAEWSRVGGTKVLNVEALDAKPVTLSLTAVSERQALDILLRDIGGYILSARGAGDHTASQFAGLVVVPARPPSSFPSRPAAVATSSLIAEPAAADEPDPANGAAGSPAVRPRGVRPVPVDANGRFTDFPRNADGTPVAMPFAPTEGSSPEAPVSSRPFSPVAGSARPGQIVPPPPPSQVTPTVRPNPPQP